MNWGAENVEWEAAESQQNNNINNNNNNNNSTRNERLSKKLAYILRYGAEREGLQVAEDGYVELGSLLTVPMLADFTAEELRAQAGSSKSMRKTNRYELKQSAGKTYIRATYGRRMERNPYHEGTQLPRLLDRCLDVMAHNTQLYDLTDFPDNYLLNCMMRRMKRYGKLNNKALRGFMVPALTHLDLWDVYVTEGTLRLLGKNCRNLKRLILRDCGYLVTDHVLCNLLKKLPNLESLNLVGCRHVTDMSLKAMTKHSKELRHLNLTFLNLLTSDAIIDLAKRLPYLQELNMYDYKGFSDEKLEELLAVAEPRRLRVEISGVTSSPADVYDSPWERPNFR